jgi:Sel1 repeat
MHATGLGTPQNMVLAQEWFQKAADGKSSGGLFGLGYMYLVGQGVQQDYEKAFKYISAVCLTLTAPSTPRTVCALSSSCLPPPGFRSGPCGCLLLPGCHAPARTRGQAPQRAACLHLLHTLSACREPACHVQCSHDAPGRQGNSTQLQASCSTAEADRREEPCCCFPAGALARSSLFSTGPAAAVV